MQQIVPAPVLLQQIDQVLSAKPAPRRNSPLDEVAGILARGRNYQWTAIYLAVAEASAERPRTEAQIAVPIHIGRKLLGAIEVSGAHAARADERLLKEVAARLARFLSGNGKWLVRKVRESAARKSAAARGAGA